MNDYTEICQSRPRPLTSLCEGDERCLFLNLYYEPH